MVPLICGPVPTDILSAENPMRYMVEKAKAKNPGYRPLEGVPAFPCFRVQLLAVPLFVRDEYVVCPCIIRALCLLLQREWQRSRSLDNNDRQGV